MTGHQDPAAPDLLPQRIDAELRLERLRLYRARTPASLAVHAAVTVFLVATLWEVAAAERLIGWLIVLLSTVFARALLWRAQRHDQRGDAPARARLPQVRAVVVATGVAWGLAGVLLFPQQDVQHQAFLAFVLAGVAAGSLTLVAFDVAAALGFTGAALAPLSFNLFIAGGREGATMAAMVLLFVAFLGLVAFRAQRDMHDTVVLRSAEALRAETVQRNQARLQQISEELGRKTEALELTLDSMAQGILSLDADGRTNFYNQRLMQLLDLPESLLAARPTMNDIARYQLEHGHYGDDLGLMIDADARAGLARWIEGGRPRIPPSYFRRTPSGMTLEIKSRHLPDGGLVRTFADVTPYFEAQRKLQDSEAQARKLAAAPQVPACTGALCTVLYIEDNPVNVLLMEAMLEREPGVRLLSALEPMGGLELAFREHPQLILLDIQLPGIDGFEVLRRLRAAASTRATPVIAISANAMPGDIRQGMEAGFDAYLTKPLEVEQLRSTVRQALQRNGAEASP